MLRACALEWTGIWDEYLCLVGFAYNNCWQASIKMARIHHNSDHTDNEITISTRKFYEE